MRTIRFILWGLFAVALAGVVVARIAMSRQRPAPVSQTSESSILFEAPNLTLTDQDGKSFSTDSLHGHPWIADFIFTSCAGSCPIMSHQMAELQKKTPAAVSFVSFTVDPKTDTPEIFRQYGQMLHADFVRWHFLTGTPQQMSDAAVAMKIAVHPADQNFALSHSDRFLLVNAAGQVVGIYQGTSSEDVGRLVEDATRLAK